MSADNSRQRLTWTTRINIREVEREMIRQFAQTDRMSVATIIGLAIEDYITARSTA